MQFKLPEIKGKYRFNVDLSRLCWFGVGGKASVVFTPHDENDLIYFLQNINNIPIFVFGVGSNTLIRDGGFDGVVIRLGSSMNFIHLLSKDTIEAGASAMDYNVSNFAMEHTIGGMEFLSGIPGTIGGGLKMNGGSYGRELSNIVKSVKAVTLEGNIIHFTNEEMQFKYRGNGLQNKYIFLSAQLQGFVSDQSDIINKMNEIKQARHSTQPVKNVKTGGSTFKNPTGLKAWECIDKAGCRGLKVGGAQMSELHCNFLINTGNATAADIEELIQTVKQRVFHALGVMLEEEIVIIGKSKL